ncbi:nuclear transport factor 2 family protein [Chitinophaga sp.]|uniref:nuclear transport factor 2 family protein n=1 Tax=Chitinophaga sp. TaxID=1869181 RepID=UPI002F95A387
MEKATEIKQLLEIYYKGFAAKSGWEDTIADDFRFTGGDMTNPTPVVGKLAYIEVIQRFSRVFSVMRVKEMMIQDSHACVIGNYDFKFPNGKEINGNVAEVWTAENGKLQSLTIYFDTQNFANNTKP